MTPEERREYNKKYREKYYQDHKEERKEQNKKHYQENREAIREQQKKYNKKYREDHPLQSLYEYIKHRCYNTKCKAFKNYGGRNIQMCQEWLNDFKAFEKWCLDNNYQKGLQIDRIDNNGDYEPANCQFVTPAENTAIGKRRKWSNNTSGYVGVCFHKGSNKWMAYITINKKNIHLGYFNTPEEALEARAAKEIEIFGKQMTNL
jgi:hypothetical protein